MLSVPASRLVRRLRQVAAGGALGLALAAAAVPERVSYDFNPGWRLCVGDPAGAAAVGFDDSGWTPVTLPHAWNEDEAFRVHIRDLSAGIAWYRKHFMLPADTAGGHVFIEFEGLRQAGEIFVNGRRVALHENGVMAFGLDLTAYLRPPGEENVIAVRTDNDWDYRERASGQAFQWLSRSFNANYGGITKNVRLHVMGDLHQTLPLYSFLGTTGVYVYATDFDLPGRTATIHVESEVLNEGKTDRTFTLAVEVVDAAGRVVQAFTGDTLTLAPAGSYNGRPGIARAAARVDGLEFWSWGYGYLYTVRTVLLENGAPVDVVATRTGFRKTGFTDGLVTLNGRVLQIKGYGQRAYNEWPALGADVPSWLSDFSNRLITESNGNTVRWMHIAPSKQDIESCDRLGILQLLPAGDAEFDPAGWMWAQRLALMRDVIVYNRNNPSVVFYEAGNRGITEEQMAEMIALRDRFDPHGGRAMGCRDMLNSAVAEWGGSMMGANKSARHPLFATEYSRDEGLRKYWDELSPPFHPNGAGKAKEPNPRWNLNQDAFAVTTVEQWYEFWRNRPGTGTRISSGGVAIHLTDANSHQRGEENYRRSGKVDAMRIPKDAFFANQVIWDGWVDLEHPRAYLIGHWNYAAGVRKAVTVVSSADSVELLLNGKSLGLGKPHARFLFSFPDVAWEPGTLRALGRDAAGRVVCETEKTTIGTPVALKLTLTTGPGGLRADGADLALVQVEAVDRAGLRHPLADNAVSFDLAGPAEWRGGIGQGPDNLILAKTLPLECGVARVLVRSRPEAGHIVLVARTPGLPDARVALDSRPVAAPGGLSRDFPDAALHSDLSRGPTPTGPSYRTRRVTVPVARVTVGAHPELAANLADSDETSEWQSEDDLATAWVRLELARPARLSEILLSFANWRLGRRPRSYPLVITVDGQEAYRGQTPLTSGGTFTLKPVTGRVVEIRLTAPCEVQPPEKWEKELSEGDAAVGTGDAGRRTLRFAMVECYEAVSSSPASPASTSL